MVVVASDDFVNIDPFSYVDQYHMHNLYNLAYISLRSVFSPPRYVARTASNLRGRGQSITVALG